MKIAIVDDDKKIFDQMQEYFVRYSWENGAELQADWYPNAAEFLASFDNRYGVVFLDIELPDMNGVDVARNLRKMDENIPLVFITNMRQYAINGYEVHADDFIVKPVPYYDFALKFGRILKKAEGLKNTKVTVKIDGMIKYIRLETIRYVEVFHHRLIYHTTEGNVETRGSLNKIEPFFRENNFERCNQCYLVNLGYVVGIDGYTLLVGDGRSSGVTDELAISHPRKKEFAAALNKYLGTII